MDLQKENKGEANEYLTENFKSKSWKGNLKWKRRIGMWVKKSRLIYLEAIEKLYENVQSQNKSQKYCIGLLENMSRDLVKQLDEANRKIEELEAEQSNKTVKRCIEQAIHKNDIHTLEIGYNPVIISESKIQFELDIWVGDDYLSSHKDCRVKIIVTGSDVKNYFQILEGKIVMKNLLEYRCENCEVEIVKEN